MDSYLLCICHECHCYDCVYRQRPKGARSTGEVKRPCPYEPSRKVRFLTLRVASNGTGRSKSRTPESLIEIKRPTDEIIGAKIQLERFYRRLNKTGKMRGL